MEGSTMQANFNSSEFMSALVKNLQVLCHGHVPFSNNIEVIGHIYLKVDSSTKLNYFLNEIVSKTDSSGTLFTSNSFHAEPKPENLTPVTMNDPNPSSSRLINKVNVVMDDSSKVATESSPVFLPKIINVQSFAADTSSVAKAVTKECGQQTQMTNVPFPELPSVPSNSVSDIIKNIKKEPCDPSEEELILSPVLASPNRPSKQKRKSTHTTKVDYSSMKMEQKEMTLKKPRIIQARKLLPKKEPDGQNDSSQSSSGDIDDIPVHFNDSALQSGSNDSNNVFPVSLLKNLSAMDEVGTSSQSVVWLNPETGAIDDSALKKALQSFNPAKRRGTYNFYSQEEKKKAIELAAQFGIAPICQKFGIPSSTLWTWRKTFEKYQAEVAAVAAKAAIKQENDSS